MDINLIINNDPNDNLGFTLERVFQEIQGLLNSFLKDDDFITQLKLAFGDGIDLESSINLINAWVKNDYSNFPKIEVRNLVDINGANGAYASVNNTIYLSQEFITRNTNNISNISHVVLEELGHAIDSQSNSQDAPGDEGAIFSALVHGINLSEEELRGIKTEDDSTVLSINDEILEIECFYGGYADCIEAYGTWIGNEWVLTPEAQMLCHRTSPTLPPTQPINGNTVCFADGRCYDLTNTTNANTTNDENLINYLEQLYSMFVSDDNVDIDNAGNTPDNARQINVSSTPSNFVDSVNENNDTDDYYRFTLNETSNLTLSLTGLSSDADVELLDSSSNNLNLSEETETSDESITQVLNTGTYYIRVYPYEGETSYNLTVSANPDNPDNVNSLLNDPLFRFQNSDRSGTYLFATEGESESIRADFPNFIEEGLAFNVSSQEGDDLIRFNRFQNTAVPGTYLYATEGESESIRANFPNFIEEGIAFYAYGADAGIGVDYYRFQNTQQPGTYLFVGEEEKNSILANFPQFALEGVAFEVGV